MLRFLLTGSASSSDIHRPTLLAFFLVRIVQEIRSRRWQASAASTPSGTGAAKEYGLTGRFSSNTGSTSGVARRSRQIDDHAGPVLREFLTLFPATSINRAILIC
jgi:hypothetical protein